MILEWNDRALASVERQAQSARGDTRTKLPPSRSWEWSIFGVQKASLNMFAEHSPCRRTLPLTGWEQNSPVDEEEIKIKMDDGVARFFTRFGGIFLILVVDLWEAQSCLVEPEWDSS